VNKLVEHQIGKLGVKINLGKKNVPSLVDKIKPDVVILATGGLPVAPEIPGIDRRNVVNGGALHHQLKLLQRFLGPNTLRSLTKFWMPLGKRVVIIGGAIQGCELAEFLVKRGRKGTIMDTPEELGALMPVRNMIKLLKWLPEKGATLINEVKFVEITDKGLTILTKEGQRQTIEADTITTALPLKPNTELLNDLKGKVPQIYAIGDCNKLGLIIHAVADGWKVANAI
jgi:pyruvate/2-oxoglutarate dehydrogenase complex dihydrolipoamide dehydrogenase (E3) component